MKNFIEVEDVKNNLDKFVIIDCRFDLVNLEYGLKEYSKNHIKNAFYLDLEKDLSSPKSVHGGRHPLANIDIFVNKLEKMGISNETKILVYDDDLSVATRLWWMLKYIGVRDGKILNGGIEAALKAGIEMQNAIPEYKSIPLGNIEISLNHSQLIKIDELKKLINEKNEEYILIDSRAPERYKGIIEPYDKIPGRIPTAINIFFKEVIEDKRIKSPTDLKTIYKDIDTSKKVIAYCGSGVTAPINIIAMDEIGISSRLYLGSYSDYVSYDDSVIEKD